MSPGKEGINNSVVSCLPLGAYNETTSQELISHPADTVFGKLHPICSLKATCGRLGRDTRVLWEINIQEQIDSNYYEFLSSSSEVHSLTNMFIKRGVIN